MVRAYVVTFAFVTLRLLHDYSPLSRPEGGVDGHTEGAQATDGHAGEK